jgi:cytochrome P450
MTSSDRPAPALAPSPARPSDIPGAAKTPPKDTHARTAPLSRGHWLTGHARAFRDEPIAFLTRSQQQFGDLFRIRLGPRVIAVACHPDHAQQVLIKDRANWGKLTELTGRFDRGLPLVLRRGLVTNFGEAWQRQRRMIQPVFHRTQVEQMAQTMTEAGARMLARWESEIDDGGALDLSEEMMKVTVDIISTTMFGTDMGHSIDFLSRRMPVLLRYAFESLTNPLTPPPSWPTPRNREFHAAMAELDGLVYELIARRVAMAGRGEAARGDLLDLLLAARDRGGDDGTGNDGGEGDTDCSATAQPGSANCVGVNGALSAQESVAPSGTALGTGMSTAQLRDEVTTIFGAGHETTANALTWAFCLLSQHDDARQRLHDEIDTQLQGRTPTLADLPSLPYTRAVLDEALRLYPPGPLLPRVALATTLLDGHRFARGDRILLAAHRLHRHPEFWPDADRFDPGRFLQDAGVPRHRCAYIPFGAGPRVCIGNHFALMEGQLLLAQIAQKFELTLQPGAVVVPEVAVTMRPRYGMGMRLGRR